MTDRAGTWNDPSPHTSHFIKVNGVRLNYLDWGGAGPPLVLIPGLGDTPHCFDDVTPALRDRYRVIAYARRGHGRSEAKSPYDTDTLVEDLRQLLDDIGLHAVHLAGWSLGGGEITRFAELYPQRVLTLTHLDAALDRSNPLWLQAMKIAPVSLFPDPQALRSLDAYRRWWQSTWFVGVHWRDAAEAHIRDMVDPQPDGSVRPTSPDSLLDEVVASYVNPGGYRRDYRRVCAPALFIFPVSWLPALPDPGLRARIDEWHAAHYRPVRNAAIERLERELRDVTIVELDAGNHNNFLFTQRNEVAAAMRAHLARS
jgi:pimeloyl-ACP methyl ester carboxylesterase